MGALSKKRVVDPVLTTLARGYVNAEYVAQALFPFAQVAKEAGKIPEFTKEAFKIYNTERAIRAKSNRINPEDRSEIAYLLTEHDLEYPIDYRESAEDVFPATQFATHVTMEGIQLRLEKIAATAALNAANYAAGNKVTLSGTDQFSHASSDPFSTFKTASEAIRAGIAKRPNTCLLSADVFATLREHSAVIDRVKYSSLGVVTVDLLKTLLDFDTLVVGEAIEVSDAGVASDIWSDKIWIGYVPKQRSNVARSLYEPSFGYTLRKANNPVVDTYTEQGKVQLVRSTDIFQAKIVGADAGYLISDVLA